MKKRTKITIGIFVAVLALWLTLFSVDYTRCGNLKAPRFAVEKISESNIIEYAGLGYTAMVEKDKSADPEKGDVIVRSELRLFGKVVSAAIS